MVTVGSASRLRYMDRATFRIAAGRLLNRPFRVDHQGMNPLTGQHNPLGPASSFAAASEPAAASGAGHGADGHAGRNGTPGTPPAGRALFARDAAARASAAVPEQRVPEQHVPDHGVPEQREPGQNGPGQSVPHQRGPAGPGPHSAGSDRGSSERDATPTQTQGAAQSHSSRPGGEDEPAVEFGIEAIEPAEEQVAGPNWLADQFSAIGRAVGRRLAGFGVALVVIAARDWLEAIAVLLQGVGGAIFPPIWFLGALITAISRKWDLRDKWLGLALPILAVIFGATLTIVLGGQQSSLSSYALEGWIAGGRLSRIGAVLGAAYLLWRLHQGLRAPRRPPWSPRRKRG
jgi:hypothetical protein